MPANGENGVAADSHPASHAAEQLPETSPPDLPETTYARNEIASAEQAASPPDITEATYAPRIETPAEVVILPVAVEPVPPADVAQEPIAPSPLSPEPAPEQPKPDLPRRRSTVREPAPIFGSAPVPVSKPVESSPIVTSSTDSEATDKPRRTGWWSRKVMGGDKG
jgi:ribonuclease E